MPDFETGVYLITNVLHPNNAALFNDNANEPVRGILPVPIGTIPRDNEKVRSATALKLFPSRIFSGSWHIMATTGTASRTSNFKRAFAAVGRHTRMAS